MHGVPWLFLMEKGVEWEQSPKLLIAMEDRPDLALQDGIADAPWRRLAFDQN